jgi:hypothetical protein
MVVCHTPEELRFARHVGYLCRDGQPKATNPHYPAAINRTVVRAKGLWEAIASYDRLESLQLTLEEEERQDVHLILYFPGPFEYRIGEILSRNGYNLHYYRPVLYPQDMVRGDRFAHDFDPEDLDGLVIGFTNDSHVAAIYEFDRCLRSFGLYSAHRVFDGVGLESVYVPGMKTEEIELKPFLAPASLWYWKDDRLVFYPSSDDSEYIDDLNDETLHHFTLQQCAVYMEGWVSSHTLHANAHTSAKVFYTKFTTRSLETTPLHLRHTLLTKDGEWAVPTGLNVYGVVANRYHQQKIDQINHSLRALEVAGTLLGPVLFPYLDNEFERLYSLLKTRPVPSDDARSLAVSQIFYDKFSGLPNSVVEVGYVMHKKQSLVELLLSLAQVLHKGVTFLWVKIKAGLAAVKQFFQELSERGHFVNEDPDQAPAADWEREGFVQMNLFGMVSNMINELLLFKSFKKKVVTKIQKMGWVKNLFSKKINVESRFPKVTAFMSMVKTMLAALLRAVVPALVEEAAKAVPIIGPIIGFLEFMAEVARFFYSEDMSIIELGFSGLLRMLFHGLSPFFLPFPVRLAIHVTLNLFLTDPYHHAVPEGERSQFNFFTLLGREIGKFRNELAFIDGRHHDNFLPDLPIAGSILDNTRHAADLIAEIPRIDDYLICSLQTRGKPIPLTLTEGLEVARDRPYMYEPGHNLIVNPLLIRPPNNIDQAVVGLYLRYLKDKRKPKRSYTMRVVKKYIDQILVDFPPVPPALFEEIEATVNEQFGGMKLAQYTRHLDAIQASDTWQTNMNEIKLIIKSDETLPPKIQEIPNPDHPDLLEPIELIKSRGIYPVPKPEINETMQGYLHAAEYLTEFFEDKEFYYFDGTLIKSWIKGCIPATFTLPKLKNPRSIGAWATRALTRDGVHLCSTGDDNYLIFCLGGVIWVISFDVKSFDFNYSAYLLNGHVLISESMQILPSAIESTLRVANAGIYMEYPTQNKGESVRITLNPLKTQVKLKSGEYVTNFKAVNLSAMAFHEIMSEFSAYLVRTPELFVRITTNVFKHLGFDLEFEEYNGVAYARPCVPTFLSLAMVNFHGVITPTMFSSTKLFVVKKDPLSIFGGNRIDPLARDNAMGKLLGAYSHANVFSDPLGVAIRNKMAEIAEQFYKVNVEGAYLEYLARTGESEYSSYVIVDIDYVDSQAFIHYMLEFGAAKGDPFPLAAYLSSVEAVREMSVMAPPLDLDGFLMFPVQDVYVRWAAHYHYGAPRGMNDL